MAWMRRRNTTCVAAHESMGIWPSTLTLEFSTHAVAPCPIFAHLTNYPILRNSASGPEIGLPGWILAGFYT